MKTKLTLTLVTFCFTVWVNAQKPFKEIGLDSESVFWCWSYRKSYWEFNRWL